MMRKMLLVICALAVTIHLAAQPIEQPRSGPEPRFALTEKDASHFAALALRCVQKEYPNKLNNTLEAASDLQTPRALHPAFYGCYDWHSTVHGHWMLVKLLKLFPSLPEAAIVRNAIDQNLSAPNILTERAYFAQKLNATFERTYGWAWLLKLAEELHTWNDAQGRQWEKNLQPLTDLIVQRFVEFLPKQTYPIRQGMHPNTAFALAFAFDFARTTGNTQLESLIRSRSRDYFLNDRNAPTSWEPNGADFLSPTLEEGDLMRRVLPAADFRIWLKRFLKDFAKTKPANMLRPATVSDRSDLQIVHLDGLNLSRAWCMAGIARTLGASDPLSSLLLRAARLHLASALPNITSGEYSGEHWLASFAVYALSAFDNTNR